MAVKSRAGSVGSTRFLVVPAYAWKADEAPPCFPLAPAPPPATAAAAPPPAGPRAGTAAAAAGAPFFPVLRLKPHCPQMVAPASSWLRQDGQRIATSAAPLLIACLPSSASV